MLLQVLSISLLVSGSLSFSSKPVGHSEGFLREPHSYRWPYPMHQSYGSAKQINTRSISDLIERVLSQNHEDGKIEQLDGYKLCMLHDPIRFFYGYETYEFGCQVKCIWFNCSREPGFFDSTITHSFANNGKCIDSKHVCLDGKCIALDGASTDVWRKNEAWWQRNYGTVRLMLSEGDFPGNHDHTSDGDIFLKVYYRSEFIGQTDSQRDTNNPHFRNTFIINLREDPTVTIQVWDRDIRESDYRGVFYFNIKNYLMYRKNGASEWITTNSADGREKYRLRLSVTWDNKSISVG